MAYTSTLFVSNIHCPSCVSYAQDVLRDVPGVHSIDVSLIDHTIRVKHDEIHTHEAIVSELLKAAFEVQHVTTTDAHGAEVHNCDVAPGLATTREPRWSWMMTRAQRKHIENCKACQRERARKSTRARTWAAVTRARKSISQKASMEDGRTGSGHTLVEERPAVIDIDGARDQTGTDGDFYTATISIGGMTCASCSGTITNELEKLEVVKSVTVSLMKNNATVIYRPPKENIDKIIETIEDVGYEAVVDEVRSPAPPAALADSSPYQVKVSLSIGGMTCGTCVGTITRGLQELPFVTSVNVDLVGNRGVVTFTDKSNLDKILEKIDDLGYDGAVVKVEDADPARRTDQPRERTVQIQIDGMYCEHCPENIAAALESNLPRQTSPATTDSRPSFTITQLPTLRDPRITVTYTPAPPDLTIRRIISTINAAPEAFTATVYHPPTMEERSRRLQWKEQKHILWRLIFTAIVAIPTFIIGIVYMSLVPKSNPTRQWFQQPIWGGNAMRMEWALFFMTTPVMFFGADLFHTRAFKEVKSMWRPKSKVPILRRFYRFGSMNLLISAGTAVAYFSSVAVLIMDATAKAMPAGSGRSSDTYFDTVTFLSFFILIGRFLEAYSKAKTGDAVAMLSNLRPSDALLVENGEEASAQNSLRKIPVDQLEVSDVVQIPHGASPPTDGTIHQEGTFLFDESSLTGESHPVKKAFGHSVYTGSVNVSDPVKVMVTEVGGTSMLDQIVNVVREGQAKRAPIERVADMLTGYFVPVITLIAILTWVIWLGLGESGQLPQAWLDVTRGGWPFWSLEFAIAVFVVACPCGIGLAAPTALFVGGGLAAKHGILVQGGGEAFQEASKLNAVVFDKTGTLTEGKMRVTDFEMLQAQTDGQKLDQAQMWAMARVMEESSTHPIAKAVVEYCLDRSSDVQVEHADIREVPGQGMTATFIFNGPSKIGYEAAIGNERLLASVNEAAGQDAMSSSLSKLDEKDGLHQVERSPDFFLTPILQKHQSLGHSTAILALRPLPDATDEKHDHSLPPPFRPVALFAIADPIRAEAPTVLQALRDSGLHVHMCTGDNQTTAHAIASQLAIPATNVRAGVLPQDKASYIKELQGVDPSSPSSRPAHSRKIIAFVGDGTNDTPALSAADVSIALSSGSDVAITTASFILLNSDLTTILELVRLAKRVFMRVKLNFAWAAVYNLCLVPVAAGVFFPVGASHSKGGWRLGPVWASVAMAASSVSVVLSSLALRLPEMRIESWGKSWWPLGRKEK